MTASRSKWLYDFSCFYTLTLIQSRLSCSSITQMHSWWVSGRCDYTASICFILFPAHLSSMLSSTEAFLLQIYGQRLRLLSPKWIVLICESIWQRRQWGQCGNSEFLKLSGPDCSGIIQKMSEAQASFQTKDGRSYFLYKPKWFNVYTLCIISTKKEKKHFLLKMVLLLECTHDWKCGLFIYSQSVWGRGEALDIIAKKWYISLCFHCKVSLKLSKQRNIKTQWLKVQGLWSNMGQLTEF